MEEAMFRDQGAVSMAILGAGCPVDCAKGGRARPDPTGRAAGSGDAAD
jgi:hypothetical protein